MTKTTMYYCDCCHKGFSTEEAAIECEKTHTPISVEVVDGKDEEPKTSREYPATVHVTFASGETVRYYSADSHRKLVDTFMAILSKDYEGHVKQAAREMAAEMVGKRKSEK